MAIEARMNPTWAGKWLLMGVLLLGWGGLCIKDAMWTYPDHNRRAAIFAELKENGKISDWPKLAANEGWPDEEPGPPHSRRDIAVQWVMLGICWPLGLAAMGMVLVQAGRRITAKEDGLHGAAGRTIRYDQITSIDKSRWDSKGIAVIHYRTEQGPGTLKLDEWVLRGAAGVLAEVEARIVFHHRGTEGTEKRMQNKK